MYREFSANLVLAECDKKCEKDQTYDACPACKDGNLPSGNHSCIKCHKAVHTLEQCSLPVDGEEEGFSQKRLYRTCSFTSEYHFKPRKA